MRRTTVRKGLHWLSCSFLLITLLTFSHEAIAVLFQLSPHSHSVLMFWGFFAAGVLGCTSIMVIIGGILQPPLVHANAPLLSALLIFMLVLMLFGYLLYRSFNDSAPPPLRPGETITI